MEKKKANRCYGGIRRRLLVAFVIPIMFVILVGILSYSVASESIISNYIQTTNNTVHMTSEYINFGFESVEATAVQYCIDSEINNYFSGVYDDKLAEKNSILRKRTQDIAAKEVSDSFIKSISLLSDKEHSITTLNVIPENFYSGFMETEQGKFLSDNSNIALWIGKNDYIDEQLKINTDDYAFRLVKKMNKANGLVIIDVDVEKIRDILASFELGEKFTAGFVTEDEKEIIIGDGEGGEFASQDFFHESLSSDDTSSSKYVIYKGTDYLYTYSQIGETKAMVCSLIPKFEILKTVSNIKNVTMISVILACIVALIVVYFISSDIGKKINYIMKALGEVAKGNLTVTVHSKGKDEFHILADCINNMVHNMKKLISQVEDVSGYIFGSIVNVSNASNVFVSATKNIKCSMDEIEHGTIQQASDMEQCVVATDSLSNKIEVVNENTTEIGQVARNTEEVLEQGVDSMSNLDEKTRSSSSITLQVMDRIRQLDEQSRNIGTIVNTINEIAEQTTLLSLNASIEAAKAGYSGKGFAVIADEIGKLSMQSGNSANDIRKIIEDIQKQTKDIVGMAAEAKLIIEEQVTAVQETSGSFSDMDKFMETLLKSLEIIVANVKDIDLAKNNTLQFIENISEVSEQTAASVTTIAQMINDQMQAADNLKVSSDELKNLAKSLKEAVSSFDI